MKTIPCEEHFVTKRLGSLRAAEARPGAAASRGVSAVIAQLVDIGDGRVKQMDEDGIDMQVLSASAAAIQGIDAAEGTAIAREINDELAAAIKRHPTRFAGLAAMAPQDPKSAADELERAVTKLGLNGGNISSTVNSEYLDDKKFWVIFERAEKLDVPIYIHPSRPPKQMVEPYLAYEGLSDAMLAFGHDVSLHAMRLICSGIFDVYPKLSIILGHMGEAMPFWLWRIDKHWARFASYKNFKKKPSEYFKDNFYITTSGMFWQPPLIASYLAIGADRILFAVDYPYESNKMGVQFLSESPICDADKEKISHLNAERLFKIK